MLTETPVSINVCLQAGIWSFLGTTQEIPETTIIDRVNEMLGFFELLPHANNTAETIGKVIKQRFTLARTLMHGPSLLFLDGPISGPDSEIAQHVNDLIVNLTD